MLSGQRQLKYEGLCVCSLGCGRGQQRSNGFFLHFRLRENLPSSPHPEANNSAPLHMSLEQLPQHWSTSVSKARRGPFKRNICDSVSLSHNLHWLSQPEVVGTFLPALKPWAGTPCSSGGEEGQDSSPNS